MLLENNIDIPSFFPKTPKGVPICPMVRRSFAMIKLAKVVTLAIGKQPAAPTACADSGAQTLEFFKGSPDLTLKVSPVPRSCSPLGTYFPQVHAVHVPSLLSQDLQFTLSLTRSPVHLVRIFSSLCPSLGPQASPIRGARSNLVSK